MSTLEQVKQGFKTLTSTEALREGSSRTPKWIEGAGQTVIWSDCIVTLNERQGDNWVGVDELERHAEGSLPRGWALYCTGDKGKVKER
ncbi:5 -nucleotidase [Fusarium langsethiae]|uniref:5-nucleotidase n=1 Tax=Fusarium langsethiae TaxID=179993 RepID=A0A0M9EPH7_FUSLA|nr:5 -nucleotidase [Fusarium langsethiae]